MSENEHSCPNLVVKSLASDFKNNLQRSGLPFPELRRYKTLESTNPCCRAQNGTSRYPRFCARVLFLQFELHTDPPHKLYKEYQQLNHRKEERILNPIVGTFYLSEYYLMLPLKSVLFPRQWRTTYPLQSSLEHIPCSTVLECNSPKHVYHWATKFDIGRRA